MVGVRLQAQIMTVTKRAMTTTTMIPASVVALHPDRQLAQPLGSAIVFGSLMSTPATSYQANLS